MGKPCAGKSMPLPEISSKRRWADLILACQFSSSAVQPEFRHLRIWLPAAGNGAQGRPLTLRLLPGGKSTHFACGQVTSRAGRAVQFLLCRLQPASTSSTTTTSIPSRASPVHTHTHTRRGRTLAFPPDQARLKRRPAEEEPRQQLEEAEGRGGGREREKDKPGKADGTLQPQPASGGRRFWLRKPLRKKRHGEFWRRPSRRAKAPPEQTPTPAALAHPAGLGSKVRPAGATLRRSSLLLSRRSSSPYLF